MCSRAFALFVCLCCGRAPAVSQQLTTDPKSDWSTAYHAARDAWSRKEYSDAERLYRRCLEISTTPVERARVENDLGITLEALQRFHEARPFLEDAAALWRSQPNKDEYLGQTLSNLGDLLRAMADYAQSERVLREGLALKISTPLLKAELSIRLGDLLREQGRKQEARELFESVLSMRPLSTASHVDALLGLADLDRRDFRWDRSIKQWEEAARLASQDESSAFMEAVALRGLAQTHMDQQEFSRAEPLLRRALSITAATVEKNSTQYAGTLICLGETYRAQKKFALAEKALLEAKEISLNILGPEHPQTALVLEYLADLYSAMGSAQKARTLAEQGYQLLVSRLGESSLAAIDAMINRAYVAETAGDLAGAHRDYERAIALLRGNATRSDDDLLLVATERYAAVLKREHLKRQASTAADQAKALRATMSLRR